MSDNCQQTVRCGPEDLRQALSIHTRKITDSCRDKDCIEDLRVYLTRPSQAALEQAAGAKVRCADLLYTYIDVEPVAFDRNHYCIDVTFYYRILADATVGCLRPAALYGLAVFSKRAVLCGEESCAHIYTSDTRIDQCDGPSILSSNKPTAVVEVLDPMVLSSKVQEVCACSCKDSSTPQLPAPIVKLFDDELVKSPMCPTCTNPLELRAKPLHSRGQRYTFLHECKKCGKMMTTLKLMRNFNDTWRARITVERATEEKLCEFNAAVERASVRRRTKRRAPHPKRKPQAEKSIEA